MKLGNQQERLQGDLHWLAGMWEAEGWISMQTGHNPKGRYVPNCGLTNTDMEIMEDIFSSFLLEL